jgi:hypothetical protein
MGCFDCKYHQRVHYFIEEGGDIKSLTAEVGGKYGYPNEECAKTPEISGQHVCLYLKSTFYTARGYEECPHEQDR